MSRLWKMSSRIGLAVALLTVSSAVQASVFSDVSESPSTGSPLFGDASEVGELALDFDPTEFKSLTIGQGSSIVDSQLSFTVSGTPIIGIWIWERGDYALAGAGSATAMATADMSIFWEVEEVDGVELTEPLNGDMSVDIGSWTLSTDGVGGGAFEGHALVEIDSFLASEGVSGTATRVHVTFDNNLSTSATANGAAFIAKKDVDIVIHVPEPVSASMAGIGLLGVFGLVRRRRRW